MARESLHGQMVGSTKETTTMIRNKDTEYSPGPIQEGMMGSGTMENSMEREFIPLVKEKSEGENGKKEKELDGLLTNDLLY
jgi:hypothetical protein